MAQPYDYSLNIPSPLQAFGQAFNVGAAGQKARYAREDRAAAIAKKASDDAFIEAMFAIPVQDRTQDQYLRLGMINPQIAELAQQQFDSMSEQQQQNSFLDATQIHTALRGSLLGETDFEMVDQIIARRVDATKGNPALNKMWSDAREIARTDPEAAEAMVGARIATLPGGKEYFDAMKTRGEEARAVALDPQKRAEQKLKVEKLQDEIKFNKFEGFQLMAEAGVDINSLVAEDSQIRGPLEQIAKRQKQLQLAEKAKNTAAAEKLQLEIANLKNTAQEKAQTKINDVNNALSGSDDLITFINKILKAGGSPTDPDSAMYEVFGTISGALPSLKQENVNFEKMIDTLKSKIYLDKVALMRGTGPLSDREGAKLETAMRSLDLRQGPQQAFDNLIEIQELAVANQGLIKKKYGDIPTLERQAAGELAESSDVAETFKVETPLGTYFFDSEEAMIEYKRKTGT